MVEEVLAMWFARMQAKKGIVTDAIQLEKGRFFAEHLSCPEFTASAGWLSRFKSRHGISLRLLHGEAASVNTGAASAARAQLQDVISAFAPCNVENIDETGLFYRMPPSKSLSQVPRHRMWVMAV